MLRKRLKGLHEQVQDRVQGMVADRIVAKGKELIEERLQKKPQNQDTKKSSVLPNNVTASVAEGKKIIETALEEVPNILKEHNIPEHIQAQVKEKIKEKLLEQSTKTAVVIALYNLLLTPIFYQVDTRLGLAATLVINALVLHKLHEVGKNSRTGLQLMNQAHTFFATVTNTDDHKWKKEALTLLKGGETVYGDYTYGF